MLSGLTQLVRPAVFRSTVDMCVQQTQDRRLCKNLIPGSIHHEHDFPWGIGAFPSEIIQTAPMPWGGTVFIMNTTPDEISQPG